MQPLNFLISTMLKAIRIVIQLITAGQLKEAVDKLKTLETTLEKYSEE